MNVTLAALVRRWRDAAPGRVLYGGRYGMAALSTGDWLPLSAGTAADLERWLVRVESRPGMALGGGRDRLPGVEAGAAFERLASAHIHTLFLIGGSGTMSAGRAVAQQAARFGMRLHVVGVPKTIDNDIPGTDVSPGFPSAARFLIDLVRDVGADVTSMRGYEDVVLIEVMGRHAGWLAASTLLARGRPEDAPHLVLLPEVPVDAAAFVEHVRQQHAKAGLCVVTVAEGVRDPGGTFLAELSAPRGVERDPSGQVILGRSGGPLPYLAALVRDRLALRCRLVRPDVLQRCSSAHVTAFDRGIASQVGTAAVDLVERAMDSTPFMVGLRRCPGEWKTEPVPLDQVRGERTLPPELVADPERLRATLEGLT